MSQQEVVGSGIQKIKVRLDYHESYAGVRKTESDQEGMHSAIGITTQQVDQLLDATPGEIGILYQAFIREVPYEGPIPKYPYTTIDELTSDFIAFSKRYASLYRYDRKDYQYLGLRKLYNLQVSLGFASAMLQDNEDEFRFRLDFWERLRRGQGRRLTTWRMLDKSCPASIRQTADVSPIFAKLLIFRHDLDQMGDHHDSEVQQQLMIFENDRRVVAPAKAMWPGVVEAIPYSRYDLSSQPDFPNPHPSRLILPDIGKLNCGRGLPYLARVVERRVQNFDQGKKVTQNY